jgi:hypothetical protein
MVSLWRRYRSVRPVLIVGLYGIGVTILALSQMIAVTEQGSVVNGVSASVPVRSAALSGGFASVRAEDTV